MGDFFDARASGRINFTVFSDLVASFKFIPLAKTGSSGPPADGGVIEEEGVVE